MLWQCGQLRFVPISIPSLYGTTSVGRTKNAREIPAKGAAERSQSGDG